MERELGSSARIGFTGKNDDKQYFYWYNNNLNLIPNYVGLEKWLAFSPAKYSVQGGMALANAGIPPRWSEKSRIWDVNGWVSD